MPFGAIKDLVSRGGRKAAESGKKAAVKAREYDKKMVERHGEDSDAVDRLTGDDRRRSMQSPDMALGLDDDGGDRWENSPSFNDLGPTDADDTDSPRLGELGFAGGSGGGDDMTPGVPDMMGDDDNNDDRLW